MAYDKPFRLRVLIALTEHLKTITIANGYKHDLSDRVFRGRIAYGENDPVPLVSILEEPMPEDAMPTPPGGRIQVATDWKLVLQGFVQDDPENPTDNAHYLVADVIGALAAARQQVDSPNGILGFKGLIEEITISSPSCRPADDISAVAYFWLRVNLKVVEDLMDPYG